MQVPPSGAPPQTLGAPPPPQMAGAAQAPHWSSPPQPSPTGPQSPPAQVRGTQRVGAAAHAGRAAPAAGQRRGTAPAGEQPAAAVRRGAAARRRARRRSRGRSRRRRRRWRCRRRRSSGAGYTSRTGGLPRSRRRWARRRRPQRRSSGRRRRRRASQRRGRAGRPGPPQSLRVRRRRRRRCGRNLISLPPAQEASSTATVGTDASNATTGRIREPMPSNRITATGQSRWRVPGAISVSRSGTAAVAAGASAGIGGRLRRPCRCSPPSTSSTERPSASTRAGTTP